MKTRTYISIIYFLFATIVGNAQTVASFTVQPSTASCEVPMQFDGNSSYASQGHNIIKYEWDFDYDGITFDVQATGAFVEYSYPRMNVTGSGEDMIIIPYTVALRVTDDSNPAETDIATGNATLSFQNNAPIADAGGPYYSTLINDAPVPVTITGNSFDPDIPCDEVVTYKWDTDGDGLFGSDDTDGGLCNGSECEGSTITIVDSYWSFGESVIIGLRVIDSYGLVSNASETTVQIDEVNNIPPTIHEVIIDDVVSGDAFFEFSVSHPDKTPQTFDCSFYINDIEVAVYDKDDNLMTQIDYNGSNTVQNYIGYFDATAFSDGFYTYTLKVVVTTSDNRTSYHTTRPFSIDNTPPSNPTTCSDTGSTSEECTTDNDPDFTWSGASDNYSNKLDYYFYWGTDSSGESITNLTTYNGYNPDLLLANDIYYLRINTKDEVGNEAGWTTLYTYKYFNFTHIDTDSICDNDSLLWHGNYYNTAGTYYDSLVSTNGCDSIYELQLTVNPTYYFIEQDTICSNDSLLWQGNYYNTTGTYFVDYNTVAGCDSIFELDLFTNPSPSSFIITGQNTVTENQIEIYFVPNNSNVTYNWNIQNGNITNQISNEMTEIQWDTAGEGYIYVIAVDQNGCVSDTATLEVAIGTTGFNTLLNNSNIIIYPNPVKNIIHVDYNKEFSMEIYNSIGEIMIISKRTETDVSNLKTGTYIILIKNEENKLIKINKLVKE